jgi:hypothetical protein
MLAALAPEAATIVATKAAAKILVIGVPCVGWEHSYLPERPRDVIGVTYCLFVERTRYVLLQIGADQKYVATLKGC